MAYLGLFTHRKFLRLRFALRMPTPHVVGHLECLWHHAYQRGDAVMGDAQDVEAAADWQGEPGVFAAAAAAAGFLDTMPDGQLAVHDLYDHAPKVVKERMQYHGRVPTEKQWKTVDGKPAEGANQRRANGIPSASRSHTHKREKGKEKREKRTTPLPLTPAPAGEPVAADGSEPEAAAEGPEPKFDPRKIPLPHGPVFAEAWGNWCEHRREVRKPLKPTGAKQQLEMLAGLSENHAVNTLRASVANSWQGLFPESSAARGEPSPAARPRDSPPAGPTLAERLRARGFDVADPTTPEAAQ